MAIDSMVGYEIINGHYEDWTSRLAGKLFSYLIAGTGAFVWATRPGLSAIVPVSEFEVRGLPALKPALMLSYSRVPVNYLEKMLELSRSACIDKARKVEALFHLLWLDDEQRWRLDMPEQEASGGAVRPLDDGPGSSYEQALIEVHSHHEMSPFFSGADDADEQGFRIYGVLGNIFSEPKLRVRVGVFGHFWEVAADTIFEMPDGLEDAVNSGETEE